MGQDVPLTYLIAEAGTNHAGKNTAARLFNAHSCIEQAKAAGFDAVKFQLFRPQRKLFCPLPGDDGRWHRRWKHTILSQSDWEQIKKFCDDIRIDLILSAFQSTGVSLVNRLGIPHKVASRAVKTYPYHEANGPFIISNGFNLTLDFPFPKEHKLLYCVSEYPTPLVKSIPSVKFDGMSDHSGKIFPSLFCIYHKFDVVEVHLRPDGS